MKELIVLALFSLAFGSPVQAQTPGVCVNGSCQTGRVAGAVQVIQCGFVQMSGAIAEKVEAIGRGEFRGECRLRLANVGEAIVYRITHPFGGRLRGCKNCQ